MKRYLLEARKALAAASGAVAELVSLGLLHGAAEKWVTGVIAAATSAAVYLVPNGKTPTAPTPPAPAAPLAPAPAAK